MSISKIMANWPAPANVIAFTTCRHHGRSGGAFASLNFGYTTGDKHEQVTANRVLLKEELPDEPYWIEQVHQAKVVEIDRSLALPQADGSFTQESNRVCAILTADCLPVLLTNKQGTQVAAVHAGWRSLAAGILPNALQYFTDPSNVLVWFGPAISQAVYEVGPELKEAFLKIHDDFSLAFKPGRGDRSHADLTHIAQIFLEQHGVSSFYKSSICTYSQPTDFYSYRRENPTGRMVSLIYFQ